MTDNELVNKLWTIARLGTEAFNEATSTDDDNSMLKQFGVQDSGIDMTKNQPVKPMCDGENQ